MSHWNCRLNFSIRFCLQQLNLVWPRCPRISLNCNDWTLPNGRCSEQLWGVGGGGFNWLDNNVQRMNEKLDAALRLYPISPWSDAVFRKQFPLICACLSTSGAMACSSNCWNPLDNAEGYFTNQPFRKRERPQVRWDDNLRKFGGMQF